MVFIKQMNNWGCQYLTLILSEEKYKVVEEIWRNVWKIKYLIKEKNNNLDDYNKKYMEIRINSGDDLPLQKI